MFRDWHPAVRELAAEGETKLLRRRALGEHEPGEAAEALEDLQAALAVTAARRQRVAFLVVVDPALPQREGENIDEGGDRRVQLDVVDPEHLRARVDVVAGDREEHEDWTAASAVARIAKKLLPDDPKAGFNAMLELAPRTPA